MSEDDAIALSALQHYLYCPRQCALIHVEQLWAESRHTAEGRLLHEKADKPKAERRKGVRTVTAMPLADTRLGITGIAGPTGGSTAKPVGTVVVAVAGPGDRCVVRTVRVPGDRAMVRQLAVQTALDLVRRVLTGADYN